MSDRAYLYAAQFSNGAIKLGRGRNPDERIASHRARLSVLGIDVVSKHVIACDHSAEREAKACEMASQFPGVTTNKREWFTGLSFEDAVSILCEVTKRDRPHMSDKAAPGTSREVLALNLRAHMAASGEKSMRAWAIAHKLDQRMVHRAMHGAHAINLDTLDSICGATGLSAAELLYVPVVSASVAKPEGESQ
jgi:hypothetical protein